MPYCRCQSTRPKGFPHPRNLVADSDLIRSRWCISTPWQAKPNFDERGGPTAPSSGQLCTGRHGLALQCLQKGTPRLPEDLKQIALNVGHLRVGRVTLANDPPDHLWNLGHCARTAYPQSERTNTKAQPMLTKVQSRSQADQSGIHSRCANNQH